MYRYRFAAVGLTSELPIGSCEPFRTEGLDGVAAQMELRYAGAPFSLPPEGPVSVHEALSVYKIPDGWIYMGRDGDMLRLSRDYSRLLYSPGSRSVPDGTLGGLLRPAIECLSIRQGVLSLHSACVRTGEGAVCFTGKSGLGKSTRANAMMQALGTDLISGDRPQILTEGGRMIVSGVPWDGKEQICRNIRLPLTAILEVRRSAGVRLRYLDNGQKLRLLMRQCFIPMWDSETASLAILAVRRLAGRSEILRCFCGPEPEDAGEVWRILTERTEEILPAQKDLEVRPGWTLQTNRKTALLIREEDRKAGSGPAIRLNELSAFVWERLSQGVAYEDLICMIASEYEAEERTVRMDLDELLTQFRGFGLIDPRTDGQGRLY